MYLTLPVAGRAGIPTNVAAVLLNVTVTEAEELLAGVPVVPVLAGTIADIKRVRAQCLEAGIPVLMGCPPGAGKG